MTTNHVIATATATTTALTTTTHLDYQLQPSKLVPPCRVRAGVKPRPFRLKPERAWTKHPNKLSLSECHQPSFHQHHTEKLHLKAQFDIPTTAAANRQSIYCAYPFGCLHPHAYLLVKRCSAHLLPPPNPTTPTNRPVHTPFPSSTHTNTVHQNKKTCRSSGRHIDGRGRADSPEETLSPAPPACWSRATPSECKWTPTPTMTISFRQKCCHHRHLPLLSVGLEGMTPRQPRLLLLPKKSPSAVRTGLRGRRWPGGGDGHNNGHSPIIQAGLVAAMATGIQQRF